jgi:hypothetical protein
MGTRDGVKPRIHVRISTDWLRALEQRAILDGDDVSGVVRRYIVEGLRRARTHDEKDLAALVESVRSETEA